MTEFAPRGTERRPRSESGLTNGAKWENEHDRWRTRDRVSHRLPASCKRCGHELISGKGGNICWYQLDGRWKPGPLCKTCSTPP
jgi:hypothetical protein